MLLPAPGRVSQKHHREQHAGARLRAAFIAWRRGLDAAKSLAVATLAGIVLAGFILAGSTATMSHAATPQPASPLRIVALGDSLTAGYALPQAFAFPVLLEAALKARGHDVAIANAGVSGDTSTGGLARLDWSVPEGTQAVILELGANDMLRGVDPAITEKALDDIITRLKARGIAVLLAGMRAAPNLGEDYARRFEGVYTALATRHDLVLYPFFLDGVTGNEAHVLPDGLHPNQAGVAVIVERILPTVERFLADIPAR